MRENRLEKVSKIVMVILLISSFLVSCSVESRLNRSYKGKYFSEVMLKFGAPTHVENLVGGGTIRTFEKKKMLKDTPINTGSFQYDQFRSPKVLQTEKTQFLVDSSGTIKEVKYSCEFGR